MPSGGKSKKGPSGAARDIAASLLGEAAASIPAIATGARVAGRYVVRGEIAHGGMGTVLDAWDEATGRAIALKVIRLGADLSPRVRDRFLHEAQVTARLEHPNIVPVHDLGEWPDPATGAKQAYYCMKKIEGEDLRAILKRREWSRTRLLQVFQDVCMAVAYAHDRGVIHRDLKPGNVMVGKFGETLVVDWGLAKVKGRGPEGLRASGERPLLRSAADESTAMTIEGDAIGTPGYMSPEQAAGRRDDVDERSDVFSLGVMLREILGEGAPPDLAKAAERAASPERSARHASARELFDEVQAHLEGARRRAMAIEKTEEGRRLAEELPRLRDARERSLADAKALKATIRAKTPIEEKRAAWSAADEAKTLRNQLTDAFAAAHGAYTAALGMDATCPEARAGLAGLYWDRFAEAERAEDAEQMRLYAGLIAQVDDGAYAARLRGDGELAVRTRRYACGCLLSKGAHGEGCTPVELQGAEATLFEWRERDRRLVLERPSRMEGRTVSVADIGEGLALGRTPLAAIRIPLGRYLLVLTAPGRATTRFPLRIRREDKADASVTMFAPDEIPRGFLHVPAGPAPVAGDGVADQDESWIADLPDYFIARIPVTNADWIEFLNDLSPADAASHAPRGDADLAPLWSPGPDGRYTLPPPDARRKWHPQEPLTGLAWASATAYAAWKSDRENRLFALPTDDEWEKAARGVDERRYPWGDFHDPSFCNSRDAFDGTPTLMPAGSFPVDESPYGALDMAGNAATWCRNGLQDTGEGWRAVRGGACMNTGSLIRSAYRFGIREKIIRPYVGVRLVMHLVAEESGPPHA